MLKKLLITGLSGKIGYILGPLLKKHYSISGILHRQKITDPDIETFKGSLDDAAFLEKVLDQARPEYLLHLGVLPSIALCQDDHDLAHRVNVGATAALAGLCSQLGTRMLFTSTDMVYDGQTGNYCEDDPPSPISVYGKSKAEAENAVIDKGFLVYRLALNYGPCPPHNPSFFYQIYKKLLNSEPVTLFEDEIRSALYTPDLAPLVIAGLENNVSGLYHVGGPLNISRLDLGRELSRQMGADEGLLVPARIKGDERFADRPPDLSFNIGKLRSTFSDVILRTPKEGIADFLSHLQKKTTYTK